MPLIPDQIRAEIATLGVPQATLAFVAGIDAPRLSAALNGRIKLNGDEHKIEEALAGLKALKDSANVPIDFSNSAAVKAAIERQKEQQERAVSVIKQTLQKLGLGKGSNFDTDKLGALQFRHPLSVFTIERVLQGQGSAEQVQVVADLVAQLNHLNDVFQQSGGIDCEHEDLREIRWQLARMYSVR
jgi:hypothetical protein